MAGRLLDRLKLIIRSELFDLENVAAEQDSHAALDETLEDLKTELGQAIAERHQIQKSSADLTEASTDWDTKANQALEHGRDDLAKAALTQKHTIDRDAAELKTRSARLSDLVKALEDIIGGLQSSSPDNQALAAQLAELDALIGQSQTDRKTD